MGFNSCIIVLSSNERGVPESISGLSVRKAEERRSKPIGSILIKVASGSNNNGYKVFLARFI